MISEAVRLKESKLTAERLRLLLHYDPKSGIFRWRNTECKRLKTGDIAGCAIKGRSTRIHLIGHQYRAHRLAWLYMTGGWPEHEVDHRDRDPSNNKWRNLRVATHQQNLCNTKLRSDNTSGGKGVRLDKRNGRWRARIHIGNRERSVGAFDTFDEASAAYAAAARKQFGEFANP